MPASLGVVLAGGKSSRFGDDKALASLQGERLIESAIRILRELNLPPLVVTEKNRDYGFLNCPIAYDLYPEKGPLGGLYTACKLHPNETLLVLTCDMPNLTREVLQTLSSQHQPKFSVTLFDLGKEYIQPFPGIYAGGLAERMGFALEKRQLSMQQFFRDIGGVNLVPSNYPDPIFKNINHKSDLR